MFVQGCKTSSEAASCSVQHLALTTVLCFYKSDYFPSAFNKKKKKRWSLTHTLKTACTGYRGWEFQQRPRLELFSNRKSNMGDKGGGAERGGQAEQEIAPELRLSCGKGSWRPGAPPAPRKVAQTQE